MKTVLTRKYYRNKKFKITTYLIPLNKKPYQSHRAWKYLKVIEKHLYNREWFILNSVEIYNFKYS